MQRPRAELPDATRLRYKSHADEPKEEAMKRMSEFVDAVTTAQLHEQDDTRAIGEEAEQYGDDDEQGQRVRDVLGRVSAEVGQGTPRRVAEVVNRCPVCDVDVQVGDEIYPVRIDRVAAAKGADGVDSDTAVGTSTVLTTSSSTSSIPDTPGAAVNESPHRHDDGDTVGDSLVSSNKAPGAGRPSRGLPDEVYHKTRWLWAHTACALRLCGGAELDRPTCPHFYRRGTCAFGDGCFFAHPPRDASGAAAHGRSRRKRNVGKAGVLRRWLHDTFGVDALARGTGILDVAGGKGELSFELVNLSGVPATVLDPRAVILDAFERKLEAGMYTKVPMFRRYIDQDTLRHTMLRPRSPSHVKMFLTSQTIDWVVGAERGEPTCHRAVDARRDTDTDDDHTVTDAGDERLLSHEELAQSQADGARGEDDDVDADRCTDGDGFFARATRQATGTVLVGETGRLQVYERGLRKNQMEVRGADDACVEGVAAVTPVVDEAHTLELLRGCSVIIGLHPDGAAEPMIDLALRMRKPFACVPCCTCSQDFPFRRYNDRPVRSYGDLCDYLQAKDPRIQRAILDLEGRNVVLYVLPEAFADSAPDCG